MRQHGLEVISKYQEESLSAPQQATKGATEYDFQIAETVVVPSFWELQQVGGNPGPILVKTGIKAYMPDSEYLELVSCSSNPLKRFLLLANGAEVIDSDYYSNENNEEHIMFQFLNFGHGSIVIEKGEQIGQGIFGPFLLADDDQVGVERTGGFGSSGQR